METTLKRHGFVTFWLWLGIVANVISGPSSILGYQNLKNLGFYGMQLISAGVDIDPYMSAIGTYATILQCVALLAAVLLIVGYKKLLNWKKSGFILNAVTGVVSSIVNAAMIYLISQEYAKLGMILPTELQSIIAPIGAVFSIFILWAILQIKKDGVSCWSQLK